MIGLCIFPNFILLIMKKLTIKICLLFFYPILFLGQTNDTITNPYLLIEPSYDGSYDTTYSPQGYDPNADDYEYLDNTLWLGDETQGAVPYDALYADDKVYIYGDRRIVVLDYQTNEVQTSIDISEYSSNVVTRFLRPNRIIEKRMAFDGNQKLFAVTDKLEVIVINTTTNEIEHIIPKPENFDDIIGHYYLMVKYDARNNNIYFAVNKIVAWSEGFLFIYNADNYGLEANFEYDKYISDFELNEEVDVFYLSTGNDLYVYNSSVSFAELENINTNFKFGPIVYVNDQEDEIHKVYCFSGSETVNPVNLIFDGDDYNNSSTFTTTQKSFTSAVYNPLHNKLFASYYKRNNPKETGYCIIDAEGDYELQSLPFSFDPILNSIDFGDKTILSGTKNLYVFIGDQGTGLQTIPVGEEVFMHGLACNNQNQNPEKIFITNVSNAEVFVYDSDLTLTNSTDVGGHVQYAVTNNEYDKIYFYSKGNESETKLFILDTKTNLLKTIDLGFSISGITYNEEDDKLYVTYLIESINKTYISSIDGETDTVTENEIIINRPGCTGLYWLPGNKLIISNHYSITSSFHNLTVYDIATGQYENITLSGLYTNPYNGTGIVYTKFFYDDNSNKLAISLKSYNNSVSDPSFPYRGKVVIYNNTDGTRQIIPFIYSPDDVLFSNNSEKLFVIHKSVIPFNYFSKIDLTNEQVTQIPMPDQDIPMDFEISSQNILYISRVTTHYQIEAFDCENENFLHPIRIEGPVVSLKFNEYNRKLYAFVPWNFSDNLEMQVFGISTDANSYSKVRLEQFESLHFEPGYLRTFRNDMVFDNDNRLYIGTGAHSNIKVIQCQDDVISLRPYMYNWVSYPRLPGIFGEDDPVDAQSFLSNMYPFPNFLHQDGWAPQAYESQHIRYQFGSGWSIFNGLNEIYSSRGYKILTDNTGFTYVPMSGTVLPANHEVALYSDPDTENWVGYYLPYPQSPLDALADILPDMEIAKGYDWSVVDMGMNPTIPLWVVFPEDATINYGEMAVITTTTARSFHWNQAQKAGGGSLTDPEYYSYSEEPDYTPVFIELDTANQPLEIGAFVNDTCIGATVVEPSDTLTMLRCYMIGNENDSLVFETYYGTKSSQKKRINDYYVLNKEKHLKEQRTIRIGEAKSHYVVSFKQINNATQVDKGLQIGFYPNPVHESGNIEIALNTETQISIEIFDRLGRLITRPFTGYLTKGVHTINWEPVDGQGNELIQGLYIIRVNADGATTNKKIIVK